MRNRTFVIIGAGLAGAAAAGQLRKEGFDGRVVLVGEEAALPYERPPLSKAYLRGESERGLLDVQAPTFYRDNAIDVRTSARATAVDPRHRTVVLEEGPSLRYDRLLLATGASPRRLEIPGSHLAGIHYLRSIADADAIRIAAAGAGRVVVIGGGWIGAEVAASLRQLGIAVALVAPGSVPLEGVLGIEVGAVYQDLHAEHGVELFMHQRAAAFRGRGTVEAVEMADGTRIEGGLVVVGVGAQPRTHLAAAAGLEVNRGIVVDKHLETTTPGIFAAGDVAEAWHPVFRTHVRVEHWDNARRQGRTAARNMLGKAEPYLRIPYFYSDQYDLSMGYVGYAPAWDRVVFRGDPASRSFIAFWLLARRPLAGLSANVGRASDKLATLVASGERFAVDRLVDPAIPLDEVAAPPSAAKVA